MKNLSIVQYNAPVTLTFGIISLIALILGMITDNASTLAVFSVYSSSAANPLFYIRLFGHIFGHYNFEHFFNNMVLLLLLGPILEEKYGARYIIIAMALTALITGIIQVLFFNSVLLGASGIVFMFMLLSGFAGARSRRIPLTLVLCVLIFLGREVHNAIVLDNNISQAAHIIGGLCGSFFGFYANSKQHV